MALSEIVYASAATVPFSREELVKLLSIARRNNSKIGVTGVLLYLDGSFLQVLEGHEENIETVFKRVEKDARHGNVMVLRRGEIEERSFAEWTMGFVDMRGRADGFTNFLSTGIHRAATEHANAILKTLRQFRSGRFRRQIQ